MPLSPEVRRRRRALAKSMEPVPVLKRRRCENCSKFYLRTRPNRRFCSRQCKLEFARHGSAFGPLKDTLTKLIYTRAKELLLEAVASGDLRRKLVAEGFLHRKQIRPRAEHLRPESLRAAIESLTRRIEASERTAGVSTAEPPHQPERRPER